MSKKSFLIFVFCFVFLILSIFIILFLKIDQYQATYLINTNNEGKIILNQNTYNLYENKEDISFIVNNQKYTKKIRNIYEENKSYYCIIDVINELDETIIKINLNTGKKTIFGF